MSRLIKSNSLIIKALISLGLFVIIMLRMDFTELKSLAGHIHLQTWLVALFLIFGQILTLSYRWLLLVNVNNRRMDYSTSVRITLVSLLANYLFITSIGGIIVRVALSIQHGVSVVKSITATALDRFLTLLSLVILSAVFIPMLSHLVDQELYNAARLLVVLTFVSMAAFGFLFFRKVRRNFIFAHRKIAVCYKYFRSLLTDQQLMGKVIASSLAGQLMYFGAVYVVMASLGAEIPLLHFLAVLPIITIIASLPVGYGGWGIREGAFVYGLGLIHMPIEAAFMASVQIGLISLIAALLAGVPAFMNTETQFALKGLRYKGKALRRMADAKP